MPRLHVSELRDDSIIFRCHVSFQKLHLALLNGHPVLIRNIQYISSRTVTKVTSTSIRRVAVLFMLLHRVHVLSWNKIRCCIFNTCTMYTITLQCTIFNITWMIQRLYISRWSRVTVRPCPPLIVRGSTVRPPLTTKHIEYT